MYTTPVGLPQKWPKFAWPFDGPTHMKIPRTAPPNLTVNAAKCLHLHDLLALQQVA